MRGMRNHDSPPVAASPSESRKTILRLQRPPSARTAQGALRRVGVESELLGIGARTAVQASVVPAGAGGVMSARTT
ncbi:hypothetical protein [Azospirillum argentinense]